MKNSETYIVTAKTVDEAMAVAQREYGGAGKDISFDILEMPKKGFLGLGAKDAKIKVTVTEEETISLSSIVDEMRSYRIQTDRDGTASRDGGDREERQPKKAPQENKPQQQKQQNPQKPAQQPKQSQGERQPKQQNQPQQKPQAQAQRTDKPQPKQDKPAPQQPQDKPAQPKPQQQPRQDRAPKADKPAQQPRPAEAKPVQQKPVQEKPAPQPVVEKPAEKPTEKPVESKPAPKPQPAQKPAAKVPAAKPAKVEATADGILDNMPAYTIDENREKTPVYKETGANVKTYTKSTMHTAAVADGSLGSDNAPVADVRWDSARDLKKAEEATAAAIAAAAPKPVAPISAEEAAKAADDRRSAARDNSSAAARDKRAAAQERYAAIRGKNPQTELAARADDEDPIDISGASSLLDEMFAEEETYIPSDGSIDVAALDAAIEAMVEELPAPEARKKVAITQAEMDHALAFVTTLLANMQIDAEARALPCPEGEEIETAEGADVYPAMEIVGEGTGILIGHHGETLDAIQYLLNLAAIRHSDNPTGDYVKISLDIENYRAKREETLRSLARRMAARALKYKRNVFLEPMNAYERRIIHSELQMVEGVSTHSVGTDKNRKIIITYEGADRVLDDRRPRSESGSRNGRREGNRGRGRREGAEIAEPQAAEAGEGEGTQQNGNAQGEGKSRARNRNRSRNRRRGQLDLEGPSDIQTAAGDGASAIIPPEEREELDRQLTDPGNRPAKEQKKPEVNEAELPAFLQRPADEPAEHLREN